MSRTVYPKELKESIFKRLAPPNAEKVPDIARETNIPVNTLYTWRSKIMKNNPTSNKKAKNWSSSDKFQAVLETASLSELETAKYCREKGIHVEELKSWIKQCQNANENKFKTLKN
jgi:transposase-like protein